MPYQYSPVATQALQAADQLVSDIRNAPIRNRNTQFRLMTQNILQYTFDAWIPGFSTTSHVLNTTSFDDIVRQGIANADREGQSRFAQDYDVSANAKAKVIGDLYETLTTAVLWNTAAAWNQYMNGGPWLTNPRYPRPQLARLPRRQVAVLNLPRGYDWVKLLEPGAAGQIAQMRAPLEAQGLSMPTSTPDIAIVVLPDDAARQQAVWRTPLTSLDKPTQAVLSGAHQQLAGHVEAGELILAVAAKRSLRTDRLYQPLYEANVMQLILEGHLGAPQVDFEVHTLAVEGTDAVNIYQAASLSGVATQNANIHRAVRDLYIPEHADQMVRRFLEFLETRMALVV